MLQDQQELARGCREAERGGEKEEREGENMKCSEKVLKTKLQKMTKMKVSGQPLRSVKYV